MLACAIVVLSFTITSCTRVPIVEENQVEQSTDGEEVDVRKDPDA